MYFCSGPLWQKIMGVNAALNEGSCFEESSHRDSTAITEALTQSLQAITNH